jgi:ElaB/YqjD/DUF883 family membrane-anchored ribosome-binding protein
MAATKKRAELKSKVDAAEKRNKQRQEAKTFGDYARDARNDATSFVKEHPITTLVGGVALGVLVASFVGPGRRLRKQATRRGAVLAGVLSDLALTYGSQALDGAGKATRTGKSRLGDLGETLSEALADGARSLRREAGEASDSAGSLTRDAGKRATRTLRDLRSRMSN